MSTVNRKKYLQEVKQFQNNRTSKLTATRFFNSVAVKYLLIFNFLSHHARSHSTELQDFFLLTTSKGAKQKIASSNH